MNNSNINKNSTTIGHFLSLNPIIGFYVARVDSKVAHVKLPDGDEFFAIQQFYKNDSVLVICLKWGDVYKIIEEEKTFSEWCKSMLDKSVISMEIEGP